MQKILYIEDEELMRKLVSSILSREGYEVDVVENGKMGLERLANSEKKYDLVISDVMMPFANGFEILNAIRNMENPVPAIVVSNLTNEDMILEAFRMGASDYIRKPIMAGELLIRVKRLFFSSNR